MKIFVVGAGQVGVTVVRALHDEHDLTVFDLDGSRLMALSSRYDVATVEGNGASRRVLSEAGIATADLLIACTSRDEANIVSAMITKAIASHIDDRRADDESGVPRGLAGGPARRRLHRLVRARDRPRDLEDDRRSGRPADGRLRGGPGTARRVRHRVRERAASSSASRCATRSCLPSRRSRASSAATR